MKEEEIEEELRPEDYTQLVIFKLEGEEFGTDVSQIVRVTKEESIAPIPNTPRYIEGVINLKGKVIILVNLKKKFEFGKEDEEKKLRHILIAESEDGENFGIIVDEVIGVIRVPKKYIKLPSGAVTTNLPSGFIEGVALLKDKRLIIIVDLAKLAKTQEIKKAGKELDKNIKDEKNEI